MPRIRRYTVSLLVLLAIIGIACRQPEPTTITPSDARPSPPQTIARTPSPTSREIPQPIIVDTPEQLMGSWETVGLPPMEDRMQAVHAVLLPTGEVLMASGSSNRNRWTDGDPPAIESDLFKDLSNVKIFDAIDNMGVLNPKTGEFKRLPASPVAEGQQVNDMFCAGQIHLPTGDVLFVGGTESYYPGEAFSGSAAARVFRWKTRDLVDVEPTRDGHWYPSLVPVGDGRIAVFSGLKDGSPSQMSTYVEIYDYTKESSEQWTWVDIKDLPNNPYNTRINPDSRIPDAFQMYPRIHALPDGRFLLTNDGAGWVNGGDESKNTYFVKIGPRRGDGQASYIEFTQGPPRQDVNKIYGTAIVDPNSGDILLMGGQKGPARSNTIDNGPIVPSGPLRGDYTRKGLEVTNNLERYTLPNEQDVDGSWKLTRYFLGNPRVNSNGVILPTKQFLVINGGIYAEHSPLRQPQLFTPDASAPGGYTNVHLNPGLHPRLYHSVALLLPDGRVLAAGGNANRAAYDPDDGSVKLNVFKSPKAIGERELTAVGAYKTFPEGQGIPAEIWQTEIFSPPYLFIDGERPVIQRVAGVPRDSDTHASLAYGERYSIQIEHLTGEGSLVLIKLGATTHAWDNGQRLIDLEIVERGDSALTFISPERSLVNPPGYYMLFYVNEKGKPSEAQMVQLGVTG